MAEQVQPLCQQLVQAVTVIMEPGSPQELRLEALRFCEEVKEKCPLCVPCGLQLADRSQPPIIRHFGLQLLEHVVKFRWNDMEREEKVCLKNSVMNLLAGGVRAILEEEGHIKDVLARIVVEMIKREWPQHWPDMLPELESLSKSGAVQTELVMFILLRLAEDVVTFQSDFPAQRRRDIHSSMTKSMDALFTFMLGILGDSVHRHQQLKDDPTQEDKRQEMCRVALAALNTLAGYIDWVPVGVITAEDCKLLQMLCLLLAQEELQLEAAEALLIAVSRKGVVKSREPLLILFGDNPMHYIMTAAQKAHGEGLQEKRYVFLKRLCQVLCALGGQLCTLLSSPDVKVEIPVTFGKYLHSLLTFTAHPSQFLRSSTMMTWGALFRHEVLAKDPAMLAIVPEFLRVCMANVAKVGFPSRSDSPSCEYSRLDFDSDEDFNTFYNYQVKALLADVMRPACRLDPQIAFSLAADWLQFQLSTPPDPAPQDGLCRLQAPVYVQWDAMTFFCDCIINQILKILPKEELPVSRGVDLLRCALTYESADTVILSCVLTAISALFPFVRFTSDFVPNVLNKLFSAITTELDKKGPRTRAVRSLQRHACSSLIRICRDFPDIIMPHTDLLFSRAGFLLPEPRLAPMEKCAVLEAQIILSNHCKDYEKQRNFLEQLLSPALAHWLSDEFRRAVSSPDEFISYIGRDVLCGAQQEEELCQRRRSQLSFCVHTMEAVVRRVRWPSDPEEAKSGGFLVGYSPGGTPIYRNPWSNQVLKILDPLFSLLRTFNHLYLPEMVQKMGEVYVKCLDMMDGDKKIITGKQQPLLDGLDFPVYKSSQERMQAFLCTIYDNCCQILGAIGPMLQQDFYTIAGLDALLVNSAFSNLSNLPDYRLRRMLRSFVKPFVLSCPPEISSSLLCPILTPLLNFLNQRLSQKWMGSMEDYSDLEAESSEILELELVRLLTREVVDFLVACCIAKKRAEQSTGNTGGDAVSGGPRADVDDEEMMVLDTVSAGALELTDLGKTLMSNEEASVALLTSAFSPLQWPDTPACCKAASQLCWPLLKQVLSGSLGSEAAVCLFSNVLGGLQIHGQHESCNSTLVTLAFHIYQALRPRFRELRAVMERVPDIQIQPLEVFDVNLMYPEEKHSEKRRKEQFRRLIRGCVGKPLGEQFRKVVHIRNLPSLFQKKVKAAPDPDAILGSCDAALPALFQP